MTRQNTFQKPPDLARAYTNFPSVDADGRTIWRAKSSGREAWYFASDLDGRFDLPAPNGTTYWADSPTVAIWERLGERLVDDATLFESELNFDVVSGTLVAAGLFADVAAPEAHKFGVTRELETMVPYDVPQAWAALFLTLGLLGVRYGARFTPGDANSWAIFGDAGVDDTRVEVASSTDLAVLCALAGIDVLPAFSDSTTAEHNVIDPPAV